MLIVKPFSFVPYLFILLFGMLVFYPIFDSGFLVSLDNPIHLAESYAFIDNLKETYWVSGWSMDAFVGYPLQLFPRYQLGLWLVAILNLVFSVPVNFAYKIVLFFSYVFPALALFFVTKKFFKSSLAALIPSFLFLLIRRDVVVTALTGQWNSLLALGLLIIFLYLTYSFFQKPNLKYSVITGLLFALIILSHPFAAFAAAMFFSIYFVVFWFKRHFSFRGLFYGFILFVIGALLCSFYILPLLDMPGWLDTAIGWPPTYNALALPYKVLAPFIFAVPKGVVTSQLFSALQTDFVLFLKLGWLYFVSSLPQLFIFVFGVIGLFYLFEGWKKKDSMGVFLTSLFIFILLCLVIGSGFWFLTPTLKNIPIFSNFQSYRFLVYVNISLLIFVSYAISNIRNDVYPKKLNHMYWLFDKRKIIFLILVLFFIA
ncbi:MAG: 6-pyruvoyl-tetrahydropterin synthase-related protein, partial [Candidatus Nanoarchaeia archaeon]